MLSDIASDHVIFSFKLYYDIIYWPLFSALCRLALIHSSKNARLTKRKHLLLYANDIETREHNVGMKIVTFPWQDKKRI